MFLNKIFGNNSKNSSNSNTKNSEIESSKGGFLKRISMILGLGVALNSTPTLAQEEVSQKNNQKETVSVVVREETKPVLKMGKAISGDSVSGFMIRAFGVQSGWELLVEENSGDRIKNPRTDLIAGRKYILARNEKEAINLSNIFKKKTSNSKKEESKYYQETDEKITTNIPSIGFDFSNYLKAISGIESGGKYNINNSKKGYEYNISSSKHAFGKYQFTKETLAFFGIKTEKQRIHYLNTPSLQEDIMKQFTKSNLNFALNNTIISNLKESGVYLHEILASMHHMGSGGVERVARYAIQHNNPRTAFFKKLKDSKDWLGTETSNYVEITSNNYENLVGLKLSKNLDLKEEQKETLVILANNSKIEEKEVIAQVVPQKVELKEEQKETLVILANNSKSDVKIEGNVIKGDFTINRNKTNGDEGRFIKVASLDTNQTVSEPIKLKITPTIETSIITKKSFKNEVLSKIASNNNLTEKFRDKLAKELSIIDDLNSYEVSQETKADFNKIVISKLQYNLKDEDSRNNLIQKLSKYDDLRTYYQEQIVHYVNVLGTSDDDLAKARAKKIIPGIFTLIKDASITMIASNDKYSDLRKVA